jgi:predicted ferric reductase
MAQRTVPIAVSPPRRPVGASRGRRRVPRRAPAWWRDVAGLAVWMSLLIVVALWVSNRNLQNMATASGLATSLGRLTGLVAADLLLVQVLLMARIPFVERTFGQDDLARRHRLVGFTSFNLMLAHIVLVIPGYAGTDQIGVVSEAWQMVTTFPGMLLATAGSALLVLVVVTSVRAARRRLRYESWHLLHLYAYLGVGLALPHQLWTGTDFIASPLARAYWWTAYGAVAGCVVVFRLGLPLWRSWHHQLVVQRVVREGPDVVSVYLRGRHLDQLPVASGQFFVWRFLHGSGWTRGNPFSLSAAPRANQLRITARDIGSGSQRLASIPPGTKVLIEGPYGRMTDDARQAHKVTLIASGIGITPLRALLEDLPYRPGELVLIYRASTANGFLFRRELDTLAHRRGARVVYLPGRRAHHRPSWLPGQHANRRDDVVLREIVPDIRHHDVFVCGPDGWADTVVRAVRDAGVPEDQLHIERFAW